MKYFEFKDASANALVKTTWKPNMTEANLSNIPDEHQKMREMLTDLTQAVLEFGPNRSHHVKTLVRHRTEWPFLWEKIDNIVSFISEESGGSSNAGE